MFLRVGTSACRANFKAPVNGSLYGFNKGINSDMFTTERKPLTPQQNTACWKYTNDPEFFWCNWNRLIYDRKQPWVFVNIWGFSSPENELMGHFRKEPERCRALARQPLSYGTCLHPSFVWHPTNLFNQNHPSFFHGWVSGECEGRKCSLGNWVSVADHLFVWFLEAIKGKLRVQHWTSNLCVKCAK